MDQRRKNKHKNGNEFGYSLLNNNNESATQYLFDTKRTVVKS
ncbi:restriction modification methylase domain protein [Mycoplasmoides gallisepticum CA06_2006.052-5-2P]|uniref:Restriction modification methylase domain protein n=3 Tax=Mycoplasmoides gallisepticum TaxID=2096 RepID=D3DEI6_MYCGA|nr:restriction modification methylase domain protein [Mycoplasmoides gallisepticum str. R(low)]ADC30408.1 restriction modification methylase domain protein [Mycoplasmoides gallisepticum str. R(high)]AFP76304.1 restriction modification methylase domain protein [Mycoplasmoides gallisepticum VA94_7994-1-7P]AFP77072.1 restriction modification methylase domain protein [Mycoplasmoides gallisepticum NC95_13295-2-2P]AFP77830.1 restriction modification methylase domain protein [Mycoplasmoides gallisepti